MRATGSTLLAALLCLVSTSGCLFETAKRDGAACSRTSTCPPGQECSVDGQCLYPCPGSGCTGSDCGCSSIDRGDNGGQSFGWSCESDRLCHFTCQQMGPGNYSCQAYMNCNPDTLLCVPACDRADQCANGAECLQLPAGSPTNGTPNGYCVGQETPDGGVGDGGTDGAGPDGGVWLYCGPTLVDVSQSSEHCGACDHGCKGGKCVGGVCQPYQLAVPGDTFNVKALALDGSEVYFVDQRTDTVFRCSKAGCGAASPITVASAGSPHALAVDVGGAYVYWASSNDSRLHACLKSGCGGPPLDLPFEDGHGIAADSTGLYFVSGNAVQRCNVPDCSLGATTIWDAGPDEIWTVGSFNAMVFWTTVGTTSYSGTVNVCPSSGSCSTPVVLASQEDSPAALAFSADGNEVFWRSSDAIRRCSTAGCGGSPSLVTALPYSSPFQWTDRLAVANHGIYWDYDGHVYRCGDTVCTGGAQTLPAANVSPNVVADETYVYFADPDGVYRWAP